MVSWTGAAYLADGIAARPRHLEAARVVGAVYGESPDDSLRDFPQTATWLHMLKQLPPVHHKHGETWRRQNEGDRIRGRQR